MKTKTQEKNTNKKVIEAKNISVTFPTNNKTFFSAVEDVSFHIYEKEIVGLVGESGSGKSTIGKAIVGVNSFVDGKININDFSLPNNADNINRKLRKKIAKSVQYIFQNPSGALNPTKTPRKAFVDAFKANHSYRQIQYKKFSSIFYKYFKKNEIYKNYDLDFEEKTRKFHNESKIVNKYISINSEFLNEKKKLYQKFKNQKHILISMHKSKKIKDKEYILQIKELRKTKRDQLKLLNNKYIALLNVDIFKKIPKCKKPKYFKFSKQLENKIFATILRVKKVNKSITVEELKSIFTKNHLDINIFFPEQFKIFVNKINDLNIKNEKQTIDYNIERITKLVSLTPELIFKKPNTLSGGQQQRVVIGRAIAVKPNILIADEPIAALDVSIQSQIINTLKSLREKLGISILFIAHDLNVVRNISDRIMVMYRGNIVEEGTTEDIFKRPTHPYTIKLLNAIPELLKEKHKENHDLNFSIKNRTMFQLTETHKILCTKEEFKIWKGNHET